MKFGFYISLVEMPLEIFLGKVSFAVAFVSGGLAAILMDRRCTWGAMPMKFLSSGMFIGGIGLYMNRGQDKA